MGSGKQEQALYPATHRLHSLPSGSTLGLGKLEKGLKRTSKPPLKSKITWNFSSCGPVIKLSSFWACMRHSLPSLRCAPVSLFHWEFSNHAEGQCILFSEAPAAGVHTKLAKTPWLSLVGSQTGCLTSIFQPCPPRQCRASELPAALKPTEVHWVYRHHKEATTLIFYVHLFAASWFGNLNTLAFWDRLLSFQTENY